MTPPPRALAPAQGLPDTGGPRGLWTPALGLPSPELCELPTRGDGAGAAWTAAL